MGTQELTKAELDRAAVLLTSVARTAFAILKREADMGWHYTKLHRLIDNVIAMCITRDCDKIVRAAKLKPSLFNIEAKAKETRVKARKDLADELRAARKRLKNLKTRIARAEYIAADKVQKYTEIEWEKAQLCALPSGCYPEAPRVFFAPTKEGLNIPARPGIYFLWDGDNVAYVGQSINLSQRLHLGNHHIMRDTHKISFLLYDRSELTWAENYYIGALRAPLNYGRMASHANTPS